MKKVLLFVLVLTMFSGTALATNGGTTVRDNVGCGLGGMMLGDKPNSFLWQCLATTLNGLCYNQAFGISSGTLDCEKMSGFVHNKQIHEYVADNMDHLIFDMAVGNGESLNALADLMEVPADQRVSLYTDLQDNFEHIFPSEDVTAEQVVQNIARVLNLS